jgi:hypothetical protein
MRLGNREKSGVYVGIIALLTALTLLVLEHV